ncbi:HNH endonuclease signature motif containing protein [Leisingera caerulea]|uniref:HNH endonuclease signature motif containing protein n=1 Tax=Leisingera caerulea TaxID=506591 RepID=UPI000413C680|nr:HNH endonuclease signature motif containing protein [Leisingera caerulea]
MKGTPWSWSEEELAWIKANAAMPRRELHAQFVEKFDRPEISYDTLRGLCKRKRWMTGRDGRYTPGRTPDNKGKKMPFNPNSARTRFKKGQTPHNKASIGDERVRDDGYIEICVAETNPYTGSAQRFVAKHRVNWERENGPVPEGYVLKCLDGDKTNTDASNWEAIPAGLLPRLSGRWTMHYDSADPELKPVLMNTAKLKHVVREREKGRPVPKLTLKRES